MSEQRYSIPLIGGKIIAVEGAFPISDPDWTLFMSVLEAMKPGLVSTPSEDGLEGRVIENEPEP